MMSGPVDHAKLTKRSAILVALACVFPIYLVFERIGDPGRGSVAAIFAIGVIGAGVAFRDMWSCVWFWLVMACLVLFHALLVIAIPWPNVEYPGPVQAGPVLVDFCFCYGSIWLAEKFQKRKKQGTE